MSARDRPSNGRRGSGALDGPGRSPAAPPSAASAPSGALLTRGRGDRAPSTVWRRRSRRRGWCPWGRRDSSRHCTRRRRGARAWPLPASTRRPGRQDRPRLPPGFPAGRGARDGKGVQAWPSGRAPSRRRRARSPSPPTRPSRSAPVDAWARPLGEDFRPDRDGGWRSRRWRGVASAASLTSTSAVGRNRRERPSHPPPGPSLEGMGRWGTIGGPGKRCGA